MSGPRVLFVGLGQMGYPICASLLKHMRAHRPSDSLMVWNRTASKADKFVQEFGQCTATRLPPPPPDVVISCVSRSSDVETIVAKVAPVMPAGGLWIDCTSGEPAASKAIAETLAAHEVDFVDAPVSGGPTGAAAGQVAVMCGGTENGVARARGYLDAFGGKGIVHVGGVGAGHAVKCVNNALNATHLVLATEGLAALKKAGVDPATAVSVLSNASGSSLQLSTRIPVEVLSGKYGYGFQLDLMRKDVEICQGLLDSVDMPQDAFLRQIKPVIAAAVEQEGPNVDYTRLSAYWQDHVRSTL